MENAGLSTFWEKLLHPGDNSQINTYLKAVTIAVVELELSSF
jgi:hypothetical protein